MTTYGIDAYGHFTISGTYLMVGELFLEIIFNFNCTFANKCSVYMLRSLHKCTQMINVPSHMYPWCSLCVENYINELLTTTITFCINEPVTLALEEGVPIQ